MKRWMSRLVVVLCLLGVVVSAQQSPPVPPGGQAPPAAPVAVPSAPAAPAPEETPVPPGVLKALMEIQQRIGAIGEGLGILQKEIDALSVEYHRTLARATPEGMAMMAVCPGGVPTCADNERRLVFRPKPPEQKPPGEGRP